MTLGIYKTCLASMTLGIGLKSLRERKGFCGIFFLNISSWLPWQEGIFRAIFDVRKIQSSSLFWCHKNQ